MAKKEFTFYGKTADELKKMSLEDFAQLIPSRDRRKLVKRGMTEQEKTVLKRVRKKEANIETHCRDMVIVPEMIGTQIRVYNGKEFFPITIEIDMLGHRLGEFVMTRKSVQHSAPGIGATKSSAALSVK
jgi:small subunit ribosomal protein S19